MTWLFLWLWLWLLARSVGERIEQRSPDNDGVDSETGREFSESLHSNTALTEQSDRRRYPESHAETEHHSTNEHSDHVPKTERPPR